jgi:hypothetical protein
MLSTRTTKVQYYLRNGRALSSKRTKHIEIQYYVTTDRISKGDMSVEWCHTSQMVADFLTKPIQGKVFLMFQDLIMGVVPLS